MKKIYILIIKFFFSWLVLSIIYFFLSEEIIKLIAPGTYNVETWIITVSSGLTMIFFIAVILFIFNLFKLKRKKQ